MVSFPNFNYNYNFYEETLLNYFTLLLTIEIYSWGYIAILLESEISTTIQS